MMDPRRSSKREEISDRADRVMSVGSAAERVGVPGSGRLFFCWCAAWRRPSLKAAAFAAEDRPGAWQLQPPFGRRVGGRTAVEETRGDAGAA